MLYTVFVGRALRARIVVYQGGGSLHFFTPCIKKVCFTPFLPLEMFYVKTSVKIIGKNDFLTQREMFKTHKYWEI